MFYINQHEQVNLLSKSLISYDGQTLLRLMSTVNDGVFILFILPYLALHIRSSSEFLELEMNNDDFVEKVKDIRNGLKFFSDGHSKTRRKVKEVSDTQDNFFVNLMRFPILKNLKLHYDLGIYFDEKGNLIGNTQCASICLNIEYDQNILGEECFKIGCGMGSQIRSIVEYNRCFIDFSDVTLFKDKKPVLFYKDYHTDKMDNVFRIALSKEQNLMLLHLASILGFTNNYLVRYLDADNNWVFRILYVNVHNVFTALNRFEAYLQQNDKEKINLSQLTSLLNYGKKEIISSTFRNCMMHYGFIDKNSSVVISKNNFNTGKMWFGLVEECFNGKKYEEYHQDLIQYSKELEQWLNSFFNFEKERLTRL